MTAVLCTVTDVRDFCRVTATTDDALLQAILDPIESLFLAQCGRQDRPFATAATGRVEVRNGTGTAQVMVDYPIASITSIALGVDVANPEETLDPTQVNVVVFATGKRAIYRTDGGVWRQRDSLSAMAPVNSYGTAPNSYGTAPTPALFPRVIHITYNHDADQPDLAKLAVKRACAAVYRQIGSEDAKSETMADGYRRDVSEVAAGDPIWQMAVQSLFEPSV